MRWNVPPVPVGLQHVLAGHVNGVASTVGIDERTEAERPLTGLCRVFSVRTIGTFHMLEFRSGRSSEDYSRLRYVSECSHA